MCGPPAFAVKNSCRDMAGNQRGNQVGARRGSPHSTLGETPTGCRLHQAAPECTPLAAGAVWTAFAGGFIVPRRCVGVWVRVVRVLQWWTAELD